MVFITIDVNAESIYNKRRYFYFLIKKKTIIR